LLRNLPISNNLKSFDAGYFTIEIVEKQVPCMHHQDHQCLIRITSVREGAYPMIDALLCLCEADQLLDALEAAVNEAGEIEGL
jgi:hypothetical protein